MKTKTREMRAADRARADRVGKRLEDLADRLRGNGDVYVAQPVDEDHVSERTVEFVMSGDTIVELVARVRRAV